MFLKIATDFLFFPNQKYQLLIAKRDRTLEGTTLFRLLLKLIEDYESETFELNDWNNIAPHKILQHLLEVSGTKQVDLVGVISPSKELISSIVNGKRAISKERAKKL